MCAGDAENDSWRGKRVTIMGLGRFSGGVSAVRFFCAKGARVTVTDMATSEQLAESLAAISECSLADVHLGEHRESDFTDTDLVVVNPAVRPNNPLLSLARRHGIPTTTEAAIFCRLNRGRTVGVTGSCGKSTTSSMIASILESDGRRVWLGGNIGRSLLGHVEEIAPTDDVVLELSSFQLHWLNEDQTSPTLAVVTNIRPNHLDWHGDFDSYRLAKQAIVRWQTDGDAAILNADDADVRTWKTRGRMVFFSSSGTTNSHLDVTERGLSVVTEEGRHEQLDVWPLQTPGQHNRENAAAAAGAAMVLGVEPEAIATGLRRFRGLPHRLELVGEVAGRRYFNDSKSTTPDSVITALRAFERPVVLIAGGSSKNVDLSPMAREIAQRAKAVALIGETARELNALLADGGSHNVPRVVAASLSDAVAWSERQANPGEAVVLSPGCASFDWFANYVDRGDQFRTLVNELRETPTG